MSQCKECNVGFATNETEQPFCLACDAGMYTDQVSSKICKKCPSGFSQISKRQLECKSCGKGYYAEAKGVVSCSECDTGQFAEKERSHKCTACPRGYSQPRKTQSECLSCNPGTYTAVENTIECNKCPPQSKTENSGSISDTECVCDQNYYAKRDTSNEANELVCFSCPPNSITKQIGATNVSFCTCQNGYWKPPDGKECLICPDHATCMNGKLPVTNPGYWKAPWRKEILNLTRNDPLNPRFPCLEPTACVGNATQEGCAPFYNSDAPLCAACARGAYKEAASFKCVACSKNYSDSVLIMLMVVIATLVVIIGFTLATVADGGEAAAVDVVILKIAINSGIISAGASAFPLAWPPVVVKMFQIYAVASASAIGDSLSGTFNRRIRRAKKRPNEFFLTFKILIFSPSFLLLFSFCSFFSFFPFFFFQPIVC